MLRKSLLMIAMCAAAAGLRLLGAQVPVAPPAPPPVSPPPPQASQKPAPRITPDEARELFASVDTILRFDSEDTGLAIHHAVKRRLISRDQVVAFLKQRMDEDKDTARIERSAVVLEKFGLLPPDFALRSFLLKLLGEQVAGFYDSKTKTVNLLDWIDADTQKPVLAHELTHALQDQFQNARGVNLDTWENAGPDGTAETFAQDREHIRDDETDTAREAALEGQAMVSYVDWGLAGHSQTLRTLPDVNPGQMDAAATSKDADSPMLASAPLVLRETLLFPYDYGLAFEQKLLKTGGRKLAFADVLERPPNTSYEILNPAFYEKQGKPPLLAMADLHPLLNAAWRPYDVGAMGAVDVRMLCAALADAGAGDDAELAWDGGLYYAAQSRQATAAQEQGSTAAIALVYLSRWKSEAAAHTFAQLYRTSLKRRYTGLVRVSDGARRTVDETGEGPVMVAEHGRYVFLSQSLDVALADRVMAAMLQAQSADQSSAAGRAPRGPLAPLSGRLEGFFLRQGVMRAGMRPVY